MKVSVIIPIYNVEEYLPRCLESIANQTFASFETILVDDGSVDNSGSICDEYAMCHNNTVVIHQDNQGLSDARNNGVKICTGEYVTFVDSDDYVAPFYIEYLMRIVDHYGVDVAIGRHLCVWKDDICEVSYVKEKIDIYDSEKAIIALLYEKKFSSTAWSKMYHKRLLLDNPYPRGILYEDMATTYRIIGSCSRVGVGNQLIYFWRQRRDSITNQSITVKHLEGLTICDNIIQYVQEFYPSAIHAAFYKYIAKICMYMPYAMKNDKNSKELFFYLKRKAKPYIMIVLKDKNARLDTKIRCVGMLLGYYPCYLVTRVAEIIKPVDARIRINRWKGIKG